MTNFKPSALLNQNHLFHSLNFSLLSLTLITHHSFWLCSIDLCWKNRGAQTKSSWARWLARIHCHCQRILGIPAISSRPRLSILSVHCLLEFFHKSFDLSWTWKYELSRSSCTRYLHLQFSQPVHVYPKSYHPHLSYHRNESSSNILIPSLDFNITD